MKIYLFRIVFVLALFLSPFIASAGTEHNMSGWAWSSNIGWISFNCSNTGTCGDSNYGVNKNPNNTLTGYAWSSNIGWIKFGGLSGFPTGGTNQDAKVDNNGNLTGWARACAGTAPGDCSTMTSRTDGWDGWISLTGTNYGVDFNSGTGKFTGYAWGNDVVGWIDFAAGVPAGVCVCGQPPVLERPVVENQTGNATSSISAALGATVTSLGIPPAFKHGIMYGTISTPGFWNPCNAQSLGFYAKKINISGANTQPFQIDVTGLSPGTTYYYRGYAVNDSDTNAACSPEGTFTTPPATDASCGEIHYSCGSDSKNPQNSNATGGTNVETSTTYAWICENKTSGLTIECNESKNRRLPIFEED